MVSSYESIELIGDMFEVYFCKTFVTSSWEKFYSGRLTIMAWVQKRDGVKGVGRAAGAFKTTVDVACLLHLLNLAMQSNVKQL